MAELSFEKISSYFHLPINEASRELKVCATILKKVCRASGISRWPHRKIRSLDNMINQLKAQLDSTTTEQERQRIQAEIFSFEEKKEYITQHPNTSYKSIVPKSTLQSFSKSKSKNSNSNFVVTPKSEEEVLEVLTKLSQVETPLHHHHYNNNVNNVNNNFNDDDNGNNNNGDFQGYGKHKYILPLKKEILKMEREKEKLKLLSQSNFSLSSPFEDFNNNNNNNNNINDDAHQSNQSSLNGTIVNNTISITTSSVIDQDTLNAKGSIQNIVHQPIEKENSANIQIISFDHNNKDSNSKKRKFDEYSDSMESLDEFRKFKSSFPSLKYHRIWENDCSLVYISHHNIN